MKKTVLVTGAAGFTGRHMASYLRSLESDIVLIGTDIISVMDSTWDQFYAIDLSDSDSVRTLIRKEAPDYVIHLAGIFGTDNIQLTYQANVLSVVTLLESIRQYCPQAVFLAAGSAAEYGRVDSEKMPICEDSPCCPVTQYGQSKYLATLTVQYYHRVYNLCTMVVRPFQLIGKGVTENLAPGAFARRLIEAKKTGSRTISVGNLESSRDFLDIHDAVRAVWNLCEKPAPGEIFNLCSSNPVKMSELLGLMISINGLDVHPSIDQSFLRGKADVSIVYGSFKKIREYCGWEPRKELVQSVQEMFE